MRQAETATFQQVLDGLLACGPLKTWSLIVTILGDLAAAKGTGVPGPVLTRLSEPMGVRPEALRVAIHRLRRDGWITSKRDGRTSRYALSEHGRSLTRDVSDRVYGPASGAAQQWHILIGQSAEALQGLDLGEMIPLGPRSALVAGSIGRLPDNVLGWVAVQGQVPDWVREAAAPDGLTQAYEVLAEALRGALALDPLAGAVDQTVLRLLALHQWRRLVLRHGAGVDALMGPDWAGATCRVRVSTLLARLARPAMAELDGAQRRQD